ncbi:MAG: hypothetical protein CMF46_01395 [Legionellales bacterium]|nr:hypothetical protein [Legionellales bacterium]
MKTTLAIVLLLCTHLAHAGTNDALSNIDHDLMRDSHNKGLQALFVRDQVNNAILQINTWLEQQPDIQPEKMAAVFDIDETLLDTYAFMETMDFSYSLDELDDWMATGSAGPIQPVQALCKMFLDAGVNVYLLTGRHEALRAATEENLKQYDCSSWQKLYMRPSNNGSDQIKNYKLAAFDEISQRGEEIILVIGDQHPDTLHMRSKVRVKLPNPYYNIMNDDVFLAFEDLKKSN